MNKSSGFEKSSERILVADRERRENIKLVEPYNVSYLDDELLGIHPSETVLVVVKYGASLGNILSTRALVYHLGRRQSYAMKSWIPSTDDIYGSSDIARNATTVIAVAPAREEGFISLDPDVVNIFVSVLKDRIGGDKGFAALMRYDLGTMQYRDEYILCKRLGNGTVKYVEKKPGWANHAISLNSSKCDLDEEF